MSKLCIIQSRVSLSALSVDGGGTAAQARYDLKSAGTQRAGVTGLKCSGSTKHSMLASLRGRAPLQSVLCCAEWMLDTAQLLLPQGRRNSLSPVALQLSQQLTGDDHGFVDGAEGEDLVLGILRDFVQEVSVGVALRVHGRWRRGHGRVTAGRAGGSPAATEWAAKHAEQGRSAAWPSKELLW